MQVVLVSFRAEGEKRSFSVVRDVTVIGRREDCDLRIPVSEVSRKHCRIVKDGDQLRVEDLGSSNGTYHNGQRVQGGTLLNPGDSVQVGPVVFVVQIDGMPPEEELVPFADRAAHNLSDSVAEASTAAALSTEEPDHETIEDNLDLLEDMPGSPEPDGLDLLDEPTTRSVAPLPEVYAEDENSLELMQEGSFGAAPTSHSAETPTGEPDLEFELPEDEEGTNAPIQMSDESDLDLPLEIEEDSHRETPPKRPAR